MYGFGPNYEKRVLNGYRLTKSMKLVGSGSFFINTTFSTGPAGGDFAREGDYWYRGRWGVFSRFERHSGYGGISARYEIGGCRWN